MFSDSKLIFIDLISGESGRKAPCGLVIAIGNFDGVHLGHRKLIETAVNTAQGLKAAGEEVEGGVFCFSEPPADYLFESPPAHICSLEKKLEIFRELGAKYAVIGDFSRLKDVEAEDFCELLENECNCRGIVCGFNFRFGRGRKGNSQTLKNIFGVKAEIIEAITTDDGMPVSSSRIRALIKEGDIVPANRLLGHPFSIEGAVLHGKALGRQLGLPTVNQNFMKNTLVPKNGIYVSAVISGGKRFPAVTNIGFRPTVEEQGKLNCETHLLDFEGELYGEKISVELLCRLRDEKKFASEAELKAAIEGDIQMARKYFSEKK